MIVYLVCYAASLLLALGRHYLLSGAGLLAAAAYLYASDYIRSGNLLHLRGIFALSFVGGQGLACMKLSYLSQAWSAGTWLGLLAAFAGFYLAFYYLEAFSGEASVRVGGHSSKASTWTRGLGVSEKARAAASMRASWPSAREQGKPYLASTRSLAMVSAVRLRARKSASG